MQKLKLGDYVKDILTGEVDIVTPSDNSLYPFRTGCELFTDEGLDLVSHLHPRFIKVDPPKKLVKKTIHGWANIYSHGADFHHDESRAKAFVNDYDLIAKAVPFTVEYEVEE